MQTNQAGWLFIADVSFIILNPWLSVRVFLQGCLATSVHDEVATHKMYQPWAPDNVRFPNCRENQVHRTNQKYWNLVGSDQQMQRLEETAELRKADRTLGLTVIYFPKFRQTRPDFFRVRSKKGKKSG